MGAESEAAGDALTGGLIAAVAENEARTAGAAESAAQGSPCLNCGATLTGNYCASCGQAARLHRSLRSLGHEILHGVFHFEGKFWRTLPELFFRPGRLTRRYIDGERVKFVSPMALFLFTVFVMFTVFSFTGGALLSEGTIAETGENVITQWQQGNQEAMEETERNIATLTRELEDPTLSPQQRAQIEEEIQKLQDARTVMEALSRGDFARIAEVGDRKSGRTAPSAGSEPGKPSEEAVQAPPVGKAEESEATSAENTFARRLGRKLERKIEGLDKNPALLAYKLKVNGYKFSWALIPLSLPFMWLLFFWRRDIRLYDHAVFVTYSISFVMLLVVLCSLASVMGVSGAWWGSALVFVPPWHMYRQLRGAYGLSRFGALVRLFFLLIATTIVLSIFFVLLLLIGALG